MDAERQKSNHEYTFGTLSEERPTDRWQQPRTTDDEETKHKASRRGDEKPSAYNQRDGDVQKWSDGAA